MEGSDNYRYGGLATLGDSSGAQTCSLYVARKWGAARRITCYTTFEDGFESVVAGANDALLVAGAYPQLFRLIQDGRLQCAEAFIMEIPDLVLAGRDGRQPERTITIFHHPATEQFLSETTTRYAYAMPVASNSAAAQLAAAEDAGHCIAVTNRLCAEHYSLAIYQVFRAKEKMPWVVLVPHP
jgi:prephenate dehydratase